MLTSVRRRPIALVAGIVLIPGAAIAQSRSDENAVTQADDGFGFSIGRESLGTYDPGNVRGFSPTTAGNLRLDGLYFDQHYFQSTLIEAVSIKVGLSAQGYPFGAPSGIVDQQLRRPASTLGASLVANTDSFGTRGVEIDGSLPVGPKLTLGFGVNASHTGFADGTHNWNQTETAVVRWKPTAGIELMPFWSLTEDSDDEAGPYFVPAGERLPKMPRQGFDEGPVWAAQRFAALNAGLLASARLGANWLFRLGAFRSAEAFRHNYSHILDQEQPDGTGEQIIYADPPGTSWSDSGELRLTRTLREGARVHAFHLSIRRREASTAFGGSDRIDLGRGSIAATVTAAPPSRLIFGAPSHQRVRQTNIGVAYDGRWKNVGELSFSLSRAMFHEETMIPGAPMAAARSMPLVYNATLSGNILPALAIYAGLARGLEENGAAPPNAANRNAPLPAILTHQKDAGIRVLVGGGLKAVVGLFDLGKPYFGFDPLNVYRQVGHVRSRGAEFSLSGSPVPGLDLVGGGVFLEARVGTGGVGQGEVGARPVGLPTHILNLNMNWKTPVKGLELDLAFLHRGRTAATTDNAVFLPPRASVTVGTHYRLKVASRKFTLRLQLANLFDNQGYGLAGSGIYGALPGRYVQVYLAADL